MLLHLFVDSLSTSVHSGAGIYAYENADQDEVENEHADGAVEADEVATSDAFAEENAVVVVIVDAEVAVVAMVHVIGHFYIAFVAVISPNIFA